MAVVLLRQAAVSERMKCGRGGVVRLVVAALLVATVTAYAAGAPSQRELTEAQAKAGFLYNCAMFITWPPAAIDGELVIGVVGDAEVEDVVEAMQGRKVNDLAVRVKPVRQNEKLDGYHILFVAGTDARATAALLIRLGDTPVLTVGEQEDFTAKGGLVRLYTDQGRLRFEINTTRVERTGLRVSAKMLGLAKIVR